MVEAKHEFIDDNPYLVYSPDAEATTAGGGGGFPVVKSDEATTALSVTAGELAEMLEKTPVFTNSIITIDDRAVQTWVMFVQHLTVESAHGFVGVAAGDVGSDAICVIFSAESSDDYPIFEN